VILQGLAGRSGDGGLTSPPKRFGDVGGNHRGDIPAQRELEREIRARDPGADSRDMGDSRLSD
jgi:hypothetical protein